MKVYLAHNYAAKGWLRQVVPMFEVVGHQITSRWITSVKSIDTDDAEMDLNDVLSSDAIVLFSEQFGPSPGKGKFIELGYALGINSEGRTMVTVLVGKDNSCIFYSLVNKQVDTIEDAIEYLTSLEGALC